MNSESLSWRLSPDLIGILDSGGIFRDTNPAWFSVLGRTPQDIESRLFFDFVHPADISMTAKAFVDLQVGKNVLQFENRYRHKDGSYRWLSWNAVPEVDLFFCSGRDVTHAKETESALAHEKSEAQLREQFISILGHDLRNPLAGALCAIEFLEREALSPNGVKILGTANQSLQRMTALIDDVLDFARSRLGGEIGVEPRPGVRLRPVLQQTLAEVRLANPDVHWEEVYEFADPVTCDPARIAQLVSNLLGNAVFHGEPGGCVRLHAREVGTDIEVSVTNSGGKIPAAIKALLFEPFKRHAPGSRQNGLGLGLFIAKQIADGHDAEINVQSEDGETTFTLSLPRGAPLQAVDHPHAAIG